MKLDVTPFPIASSCWKQIGLFPMLTASWPTRISKFPKRGGPRISIIHDYNSNWMLIFRRTKLLLCQGYVTTFYVERIYMKLFSALCYHLSHTRYSTMDLEISMTWFNFKSNIICYQTMFFQTIPCPNHVFSCWISPHEWPWRGSGVVLSTRDWNRRWLWLNMKKGPGHRHPPPYRLRIANHRHKCCFGTLADVRLSSLRQLKATKIKVCKS